MRAARDNDVIDQPDAYAARRIRQSLRSDFIVFTGRRITRGVVVGNKNERRVQRQRTSDDIRYVKSDLTCLLIGNTILREQTALSIEIKQNAAFRQAGAYQAIDVIYEQVAHAAGRSVKATTKRSDVIYDVNASCVNVRFGR